MSNNGTGPYGDLEQVTANLNKAIEKIRNRALSGLIKAAALVRRDMDKTEPLIPVSPHGGNLRASWTVIPGFDDKGNPYVICGFQASYALYVHYNIGAHFNRPGAGALFFAAALNRNHDNILKEIAKG